MSAWMLLEGTMVYGAGQARRWNEPRKVSTELLVSETG